MLNLASIPAVAESSNLQEHKYNSSPQAVALSYLSPYKYSSPSSTMKGLDSTNIQPRSYIIQHTCHTLHKVHKYSFIHQSMIKSYYKPSSGKIVVEAIKVWNQHLHCCSWYCASSWSQSHKSIREGLTRDALPRALLLVHDGTEAVLTVAMIHRIICNNGK